MDENKSTVATIEKQEPILADAENRAVDKSLGEHLSPLLVIAMQCCLIYALLLVMSGFFAGMPGPLLPIWAVFLVFFVLYWFANALRRSVEQGTIADLPVGLRRLLVRLVMGCAVLVCLIFCVWLHFYASLFSPVDPAWVRALNNDFGQADQDVQILFLGGLLSMLAWLSYRTIGEQSNAALLLSKGSPLMAILTGIGLGEGLLRSSADFWQLLLLLPIFFWFGLAAQSLQKASAKRRLHAARLEESTRYQERIIFQVMAMLGLIVAVAAFVMLFIHGDLQVSLPHSNPFTPSGATNRLKMPPPKYYGRLINLAHTSISLAQSETVVGVVSAGVVIIFVVSVVGISAYLLLKYRKKRAHQKRRDRDERKSLWQWSLFLAQCKALLLSLLLFLHSLRRKPANDASEQGNDISQVPEIRTIREVYQAFLQQATRQGYPREKDETPYEFQHRLLVKEPLLEPELETITEVYTLARYGGDIPRGDDIARIQASWNVLEGKWSIEGTATL